MPAEEKTCRSCGRRITWRKKWERDWDSVRYCSSSCRSRGVTAEDRRIEETIRSLVAGAPRGVTEAEVLTVLAAPVAGRTTPDDRKRSGGGSVTPQEAVRRAARRLVGGHEVDMVQSGQVVDPSTATGPVVLRRRR